MEPNYKTFYISPKGEVFDCTTGKWRHPQYDNYGYVRMSLANINVRIHRLVADLYIPNPEGKAEVNHIDHDKANNDVSNLEWVTHAENLAAWSDHYKARPTQRKYTPEVYLSWVTQVIQGATLGDLVTEAERKRAVIAMRDEATLHGLINEFEAALKQQKQGRTQEQRTPVVQLSKDGLTEVQEHISINHAARATGGNPGGIYGAIHRQGSSGGFRWRYK